MDKSKFTIYLWKCGVEIFHTGSDQQRWFSFLNQTVEIKYSDSLDKAIEIVTKHWSKLTNNNSDEFPSLHPEDIIECLNLKGKQ